MPRVPTKQHAKPTLKFEAVKIDSLFTVLDAIAWLDVPSIGSISVFSDIDPRTAGKVLKNARLIGLVQCPSEGSYVLAQAYPYKGSIEEKRRVVREALLRHSLIRTIREFIGLGENLEQAMRKAAVVGGESNYDKSAIAPLVTWAHSIDGVFDLNVRVESLIDDAVSTKIIRHTARSDERVAFISHSSKDKPFVRKLAADLVNTGVRVWIDEQQILVGDSIPEKVAQGLADSDFFLLIVSTNSTQSEWVKRELNGALVHEIERRKVTVLPVRIDDSELPLSVKDKLYADFRGSYEEGLKRLLNSINDRRAV